MSKPTAEQAAHATKRRGRPALAQGAGKTARVELRIQPSAKAAWQKKAELAGLSLQAWIEKQCGLVPAPLDVSNAAPGSS